MTLGIIRLLGVLCFFLQHKLKRLKTELRNWNKNSFSNVHNAVILKQGLLLGIQQNLENSSMSDIDGLLCEEKIAKEELDHALYFNSCFGKKELRCFGLKMGIKILLFFHAVVKR